MKFTGHQIWIIKASNLITHSGK